MISAEIKSRASEDISLLVSIDNHPWQYICDCGQASGFSIKEYQNTNAIFISHTHIDHFIGWDQIMRHQVGVQRKIIICGPKGIAEQIQGKIKAYTWNLVEADAITYEIREILRPDLVQVYTLRPPAWNLIPESTIESDQVFWDKDFQVRFTILDHKTDSIAYRFDEKDTVKIELKDSGFSGGPWIQTLKEAFEKNDLSRNIKIQDKEFQAGDLFHLLNIKKGNSLGVIMDHAANASNHNNIEKLFKDCDTVFMESFFMEEDKELAAAHFHSYTIQSATIMKKAGVKKAIPIHFSRKYQEEDIRLLVQEFEEAFNEVV